MHPIAETPNSDAAKTLILQAARPADGQFVGADFRGADLRGLSISFLSLAGARLDEADLRGAQFRQVDLTQASLNNARLEEARFECVQAGSASFQGIQARGMRWEQVRLVGANLSRADLTSAVMQGCRMEGACLDQADLTGALLAYCNCEDARFREALFERLDTAGGNFARADFTGGRRFFLCREIVVEILRREIADDLERAKLLGAVAIVPRWCYPEWKVFLAAHPEHYRFALEVFGRYPASGCREALREGWQPSRGAG